MTIKALNQAGAKTGDVVSISRNPGTAMKSLLVLFGIPLVGLISGTSVGGMMLQSRTIDETGLAAASLGGLLLGALAAVVAYRRISRDSRFAPIIDRILRSVAKATAIDPVCKMRVDPATAAASLTYQDTTYYFCHPGCRESFVKDPATYLRGS
jgi:YHS domain-containing protein